GAGAGPRAAQPRAARRPRGTRFPLARRDRQPAGGLRPHRQQPAVPRPWPHRAPGHRPGLHRRGRRRAGAGWHPVAGGQPPPAIRAGAGRALRRDRRDCRARRLQGGARAQGRAMKLVRLIANLGYGSRREVARMFREGRITNAAGEVLYADDRVGHGDVRIDGEPLDLPQGQLLMLHKPVGHTCSTRDPGRLVYDLLPPRFRLRRPALSTVGRLDRDTSGLLLLTDDGALLHRIILPRSNVPKTYEAEL